MKNYPTERCDVIEFLAARPSRCGDWHMSQAYDEATRLYALLAGLQSEAGESGDMLQVALCDIAIDGRVLEETDDLLSQSDRVGIAGYDKERAIDRCLSVMMEAAMTADSCADDGGGA